MFDKNIQLIKELFPQLYNELDTDYFAVEQSLELLETKTKDGLKNLKVKKENKEIFLHSSYSPYSEAEKWIEAIDIIPNITIIIGGGYFYHIDRLLESGKAKKIIIVEPSRAIFYKSLQYIDMKKYLDNDDILFLLSDNPYDISIVIAQMLILKGIQLFDIISLISYKELYSDFYKELNKSIYETLKTLRCNIATEYVHSQKWMYNNFRNLQKTNIDSVPLNPLFGCYENVPALIVSAGPSLDKQLPMLKNNINKFLILAAGSAVNVLERNGIIPHFVVAVDGEKVQDNIFKNLSSQQINLIYSHTFRYSSLEAFKGKKFWIKGNADSVVDFLEKNIEMSTEAIEFGPSCANEAMDVARKLGCNPLIFIGQDLAYTNEQLYSKDAVHNLDIKTDIGDRILTKDMYGKDIYTKTAFMVMKSYFESYIKRHNEIVYINCTEGGLNIEGMLNKPFYEAIGDLKDRDIEFFSDINEKYNNINEKLLDNNVGQKTLDFFEMVGAEAKSIKNQSDERMKRINGLIKSLDEFSIAEIQTKVDEIIEITEQIEETELHKEAIYSIIAAYYLTVRQSTYNKLEKVTDMKEKYRLLLESLYKQYQYYGLIVDTLNLAIDNINMD